MREYPLAFLGFGRIGRALAQLLVEKTDTLREVYGVRYRVTAVITRRHGAALDPGGLNVEEILRRAESGAALDRRSPADSGPADELRESRAEVLFENTPTNPENGEPAVANIRAALGNGLHVVTANKGPVVFAYRELRDLARSSGRRFLFESTVMDGTPLFSLCREALPAARVLGFRGVLNSTTNYLLTRLEEGLDWEDAILAAQEIGIAETNPIADVEGWDAAMKVAALVNVIMDFPLALKDIPRKGIGELDPGQVRRGRSENRPWKLVCRAEQTETGVAASVGPEQVEAEDPLAAVRGTSTLLHLKTDVLRGLTIQGLDPSPRTTAYGLLADFLRIAMEDQSSASIT